MANLSLYVSGQTEQNDVTEFFQKGLMSAGENPVAFFEGVFYESHQERVGNIAFQDYLIYTDKAVYLWARGSNKDYLDRFNLGSVSVNSRNKDRDFATVNLKVRREDKEPVYVIFDMVELKEAELITRLHTVIESVIEEYLGADYRKNLPDEVSAYVLRSARSVCIPQIISLRFDAPHSAQQESHIGYGQDLLEQYKATIGYANPEGAPQQGGYSPGASQGGERTPGGFSPADALKGVKNMLPTDPASLKKVAGSLKDMLGDAPLKFREQVMSDLQHVPGMLTALNELLISISDNPQAERFVLNIVKTAVKNDGMIGSVGKLMRLSSSFGGGNKKKGQRPSSKPGSAESGENSQKSRQRDDDNDGSVRRKKIHITSDDEATINDDCFGNDLAESLNNTISSASAPVSAPQKSAPRDAEDEVVPRRKSIAIKSSEENLPPLVKTMMSMDSSSPEPLEPKKKEPEGMDENGGVENISRKKIKILPDTPRDEPPSAAKVIAETQFDDSLSAEDSLPEPLDSDIQFDLEKIAAAIAESSLPEAPTKEDDGAAGDQRVIPQENREGEVVKVRRRNLDNEDQGYQ
ncbi:MAG: hypothetical protein WCK85_03750 [Chlorobium sp.]